MFGFGPRILYPACLPVNIYIYISIFPSFVILMKHHPLVEWLRNFDSMVLHGFADYSMEIRYFITNICFLGIVILDGLLK